MSSRGIQQAMQALSPASVFYSPDAFTPPQLDEKAGWWSGSAAILIAAGVAIVGIGVVGAKRGLKLM
jgi:hypothetical protein